MYQSTMQSINQAEEQDKTPATFCVRVRSILSLVTVEPLMFLFVFPSMLLTLSIVNLHMDKACRVNLQLNASVCDGLSQRNSSMYTSEEENMVQRMVANMNMWKAVIQSVLPPCLLLMLGAWSDKHNRRKLLMGFPIVGEVITVTGFILCTYFFYELPMEVTGVVESLPTSATGGWFVMFMAVYSYVGAVSTLESRTLRIGALKICATGSIMVGTAMSGICYRLIGLYGIFSTALFLFVVGLIYTVLVIREVGTAAPQANKSTYTSYKDFFNYQHMKSTFYFAFKRRDGNRRARMFVSFVLLCLTFGPVQGETSVVYLFIRKRFQWSEVEFSILFSIKIVLHLVGTVLPLLILSKYLKMDDTVIGMICYLGKFVSGFLCAFSTSPLMYCIGMVVEMFSPTTFITVRSIGTKLVSVEEQGRLNALNSIFEALIPLGFVSVYNFVYKKTIDFFPGTFYIVSSLTCIPTMILLGWLYLQRKHDIEEDKMHEQSTL
ncbi:hypothetical protein PPYR_01030 [Photinus pyralis]|uniref:Major facilitator superfamily (MFS) profile domain-containing protein n=3 Tax=Photinus pyralis TaxID=7054 RepID=A0A5N4B3V9_PHOPY|nr:uncharacterized protein LOC116158589 isoform X1 [Photinus pyralis]XP_031333207.1 uncharacterized protein LOC116163435 isoform X1 [Photinus pyralis]XP_031333215.1 uncharacterized protein LOC116163435 isoform X1 [Photinus pyralis]KAB0804060.1 hypothetical protein PPYR_01030 [Photinus pyralis]